MAPSTPPAATVTTSNTKLALIEEIIAAALQGLSLFPPTAPEAALGSALYNILLNALSLHTQESGKPFNVQLIPLETPVP